MKYNRLILVLLIAIFINVGIASGHQSSDKYLPKLGWSKGRYIASTGLVDYLGNPWKYGYAKHVDRVRRLSRTRLRFRWSYNHAHGGYITVWRGRKDQYYDYYYYIIKYY